MTHRCHSLLHAVKKSTREIRALVRERMLLPLYKGEGREMGKTSYFRCNTDFQKTQNYATDYLGFILKRSILRVDCNEMMKNG